MKTLDTIAKIIGIFGRLGLIVIMYYGIRKADRFLQQ